MGMYRQQVSFGTGGGQTPLGRNVLIASICLYCVQVVLENWMAFPVTTTLAWWGPDSGSFRFWQPVTAFLLSGPTPLSAAIDWLVLYFFWSPVERQLGRRGLLRTLGAAWLAAVALTLPLLLLGGVQGRSPYLGPTCFLTALVAVFGLANPTATILLIVLPVRAVWITWGSGILAFLFFLYARDVASAVAFFGWAGAVASFLGGRTLRRTWLRVQERWYRSRLDRTRQKARSRFTAIPGGRDDDGPVYH